MNHMNNNIFDEQVKRKLESYSEVPDMQLLQPIHAKKGRLLRIYGMYRTLFIITAIGLGLLGSFYAGKLFKSDMASNATSVNPSNKEYNTQSNKPVTPLKHVLTPNHIASDPTNAIHNESNNQGKAPVSTIRTNQQDGNEFSSPAKTSNKPNTNPEKLLMEPKQEVKVPVEPKKDERIPETGKEKKTSSCAAAFQYYASFNGEINFNNYSTGSNSLAFHWEFGDGSHSQTESPVHTYKKDGKYMVALTVSDQQGCSHVERKEVVYQTETGKLEIPSSIRGIVRAGNTPVSNTTVELFSQNNQGESKEQYWIKTNSQGEFEIPSIKAGIYFLQAYPNHETPGYAKTLWGNETEIENAPEIVITNDYNDILSGLAIDLLFIASDNTPSTSTIPPQELIEHEVILFDQENRIIGYAKMDANGKIKYNGTPISGNYKVMDPKTGVISGTVAIGGSGPSSSRNSGNLVTIPEIKSTISLNPNPASNSVNLNIHSVNSDQSTITIVDANGKEMMRTFISIEQGISNVPIDISKLPEGVYYVMVMLKDGTVVSTRLMKSDAGFEKN